MDQTANMERTISQKRVVQNIGGAKYVDVEQFTSVLNPKLCFKTFRDK